MIADDFLNWSGIPPTTVATPSLAFPDITADLLAAVTRVTEIQLHSRLWKTTTQQTTERFRNTASGVLWMAVRPMVTIIVRCLSVRVDLARRETSVYIIILVPKHDLDTISSFFHVYKPPIFAFVLMLSNNTRSCAASQIRSALFLCLNVG